MVIPLPRSSVPGGRLGGAAVLPCAMLEAAALLAPAKLRASRMVRRRARFARYWAFCARLAFGPGRTRAGAPSRAGSACWASAGPMPAETVAAHRASAAHRVVVLMIDSPSD